MYGHHQKLYHHAPSPSDQGRTEDDGKQLHFQSHGINCFPSSVTLSTSGGAVHRTVELTGLRKGANIVTLYGVSSSLEKSSLKVQARDVPADVFIKRTPITGSCTPAGEYKPGRTTSSVTASGTLTPQSDCPSDYIESVWTNRLQEGSHQYDQAQKTVDVPEITEIEMAEIMNNFRARYRHGHLDWRGVEGRLEMLREELRSNYFDWEGSHLHLLILLRQEKHQEKHQEKNNSGSERPTRHEEGEGSSVCLDISYDIKEKLRWSPKAFIDINSHTGRGLFVYKASCDNDTGESFSKNLLTIRADVVDNPPPEQSTYFSRLLRAGAANKSGSSGLQCFGSNYVYEQTPLVKEWMGSPPMLHESTVTSVRSADSGSTVEFLPTIADDVYAGNHLYQLVAFTVPVTLMHYCVPELSTYVYLQALIQDTRCPILQCPLEVKLDGKLFKTTTLPHTPLGGCAEIHLETDHGFTVELHPAMRISTGDGSVSTTCSVRVVNNYWTWATLMIGRDFPVVEGKGSIQEFEATVEDLPGQVAQRSAVDLDREIGRVVYRMVLGHGEERTVLCKYSESKEE